MDLQDALGMDKACRKQMYSAWRDYLERILDISIHGAELEVMVDLILQSRESGSVLPPGMAFSPPGISPLIQGDARTQAANVLFDTRAFDPPTATQISEAAHGRIVCPRGEPIGPMHSISILIFNMREAAIRQDLIHAIGPPGAKRIEVMSTEIPRTWASWSIFGSCVHGYWRWPANVDVDL